MKSREDLVMSNPDLLSDSGVHTSPHISATSSAVDPFGAAPFNPHGKAWFSHLVISVFLFH